MRFDENRRRAAVAIGLIFLLAAVLRLTDGSLRASQARDAWDKITYAAQVYEGRYRPVDFRQPYFLVYSAGLLMHLLPKAVLQDQWRLYGFAAFYMTFFSLLTLLVLYRQCRLLFFDRNVALLATLFFAVIPVNVIGSSYMKEDIPLMFFANLSLLGMIQMIQTGGGGSYLLAGAAAGLAVACKYMGMSLFPFYVLAHVLRVAREASRPRWKTALRPAFFGGLLLTPLAFLAFNPYVLSQWSQFAKDFAYQRAYVKLGHNDGTVIPAGDHHWLFYLRYAILPGLTWPITTLAVMGMIWALVRRRDGAVRLAALWVLWCYFSVEASPAKPFPFFARYLHAAYPLLCGFAAAAAAGALERWSARPLVRHVAALGLALIVFWPAAKSTLISRAVRTETRMEAQAWINQQLPKHARVAVDDLLPRPSPAYRSMRIIRRPLKEPLDFDWLDRHANYLIVNSSRYRRYRYCWGNSLEARLAHEAYQEIFRRYRLIKEFKPDFPFQEYGFHNPIVHVFLVRPVPEHHEKRSSDDPWPADDTAATEFRLPSDAEVNDH